MANRLTTVGGRAGSVLACALSAGCVMHSMAGPGWPASPGTLVRPGLTAADLAIDDMQGVGDVTPAEHGFVVQSVLEPMMNDPGMESAVRTSKCWFASRYPGETTCDGYYAVDSFYDDPAVQLVAVSHLLATEPNPGPATDREYIHLANLVGNHGIEIVPGPGFSDDEGPVTFVASLQPIETRSPVELSETAWFLSQVASTSASAEPGDVLSQRVRSAQAFAQARELVPDDQTVTRDDQLTAAAKAIDALRQVTSVSPLYAKAQDRIMTLAQAADGVRMADDAQIANADAMRQGWDQKDAAVQSDVEAYDQELENEGDSSDDDDDGNAPGTPFPTDPTICPGKSTVLGVDVAGDQQTNWAKVKKSGRSFAIIKATEGTWYQNEGFATDWQAAKAAGVIRGAYAYFHPGEDGKAQADYLVDTIDAQGGLQDDDLPPMLDWEVTDGVDTASDVAQAQAFLDEVEARTGRKTILYTYPAFWDSLGEPAGFESYGLNMANFETSCPLVPPPFTGFTMWQYAADVNVPGIAHHMADADEFNGTLADLKAWIAKGIPATSQSKTESASASN
jgi:GH25 family lysozyme M1 (1,4-beta-N-acetylmuramidase)